MKLAATAWLWNCQFKELREDRTVIAVDQVEASQLIPDDGSALVFGEGPSICNRNARAGSRG